ncbi:MAG: ABC transporter permease [Gemmataceae bacterium]
MPAGIETSLYELGFFLAALLLGIVVAAIAFAVLTLPGFYLVLFLIRGGLWGLQATGLRVVNYLRMMMRNITRSLLRTSLIYLAIFVLTFIICGVWSILNFISAITEEKQDNLKAIVTEKNQIPSMMKPGMEKEIADIAMHLPEGMRPKNGADDIMTWSFVGGTLDPANRSMKNTIFLFCMEPRKLLTMMDGLEDLTGDQRAQLDAAIAEMERNPKAIVVGKDRLKTLEKRVGDRIKITSINYKDLEFDFDIIGEFPEGRYDQSAVMNRSYFYSAMDQYERANGKHPMADKCMNLLWIRLPNKEAFEMMAAEVNKPGRFSPAVKMETASAAIGTWLDPYADILFAMKYFLSPVLLIIITLIVSIPVSLGVRERRTEMAVLKVLGFKPWQVLGIVLGEALLVGVLSGAISTGIIFTLVKISGGIKFPIAFFPKFMLSASILWWGPAIGGSTAFAGSILPAWFAQKTKASEVFARVT